VSFGHITEIIKASGNRIEPPCPYFGRCGGCGFQQLNYAAQLAAKVEIIRDCLRRIGGFETIPDFEIMPAPNPWHYRSRAQWQYDSVGKLLGYFESNSRRVCDVAECAVLVPALQRTLQRLRDQAREGSLPDDVRDFRAVAGDQAVSVVSGGASRMTPSRDFKDKGFEPVGKGIGSTAYTLSAEVFFQTNDDLLPQLIDYSLMGRSGDLAIDLYCGVGFFTLPLARRFRRVIGIESDAKAGGFARDNLAAAGLLNS